MIFQVVSYDFLCSGKSQSSFFFRPFSSTLPSFILSTILSQLPAKQRYQRHALLSEFRGILVQKFQNHSKVSQFLIANIDEIWANKLFKNRRKKISNFQIVGGFKGANEMWVGGGGLFAILIWCQILDSNTIGSNPSSRLFWKKIKYFWIFQGTNKCDPKHVLNTFRSNFNENCVELWFRVRKQS